MWLNLCNSLPLFHLYHSLSVFLYPSLIDSPLLFTQFTKLFPLSAALSALFSIIFCYCTIYFAHTEISWGQLINSLSSLATHSLSSSLSCSITVHSPPPTRLAIYLFSVSLFCLLFLSGLWPAYFAFLWLTRRLFAVPFSHTHTHIYTHICMCISPTHTKTNTAHCSFTQAKAFSAA